MLSLNVLKTTLKVLHQRIDLKIKECSPPRLGKKSNKLIDLEYYNDLFISGFRQIRKRHAFFTGEI